MCSSDLGVAAALVEHGGDVPMAGRHAVVGERVQIERDGLQRGVDLFGLHNRRHGKHDLVVDVGIRQLAGAGNVLRRRVAGHRQLLIRLRPRTAGVSEHHARSKRRRNHGLVHHPLLIDEFRRIIPRRECHRGRCDCLGPW